MGYKEVPYFAAFSFYNAIYMYIHKSTGKPWVDLPFFFPTSSFNSIFRRMRGGFVFVSCPLCSSFLNPLVFKTWGGGGRVGALSDRRGERIKVSAWIRFFSSPPTINICSCFSHKSLVGIKMPNYHS